MRPELVFVVAMHLSLHPLGAVQYTVQCRRHLHSGQPHGAVGAACWQEVRILR